MQMSSTRGESSKFLKSWTLKNLKSLKMAVCPQSIKNSKFNVQIPLDKLKLTQKSYYYLQNSPFLESRPQNPEFRNNPENFAHGWKIKISKIMNIWNFQYAFNSALDKFDYHQYRYWSKWNLICTSYFQFVNVWIYMLSQNFNKSLYLYLKQYTLLLSSCTVWPPSNQNVDVPM